ncbi:MAG: hypothetical protein MUF07_15170 [Steroidobacteraceae bacterium]|jgi:SAM-dependent methyltransferase|nr:hypothetical protein [Steroidobacteraceae bacterium]
MAPELAALIPERAPLPAPLPRPPAAVGDAALALASLRSGHVDAGMRLALQWLAQDVDPKGSARRPRPAAASAEAELLRCLAENPFLRAARAARRGYAGDPDCIDLALGHGRLPAETTTLGLAMYRWMCEHGATFGALRARRRHLAARIDRAAAWHPGAPVTGLFAGHARELAESRAWREARVAMQLVDYDTDALEQARVEHDAQGRVATRHAALADLLAGRIPFADCALVYAPTVADHLPDDTLARLLAALAPALRPQGEIVIPAFTRLPEPGLLEHAGDWWPNTRSRERLLRLARDLDEVAAVVHEEPPLGLAYLHLQRQSRVRAS